MASSRAQTNPPCGVTWLIALATASFWDQASLLLRYCCKSHQGSPAANNTSTASTSQAGRSDGPSQEAVAIMPTDAKMLRNGINKTKYGEKVGRAVVRNIARPAASQPHK